MDLTPQHGGDIYHFAQLLGCTPSEIIDLSSNINFIRPNITLDCNQLDIAPYPNYQQLEDAIAQRYDITPDRLELFNGATTAIYTLFRMLDPSDITLYAPLYGEYHRATKAQGANLHLINRLKHPTPPIENSLVVFVNPSTPDGSYHHIEALIEEWIRHQCTILIDESFLDFTPYRSAIAYLEQYDKLYILKSMTKFYSAAGMRIGLLISTPNNIQQIKAHEPLWKISQFDSHYLQSALSDPLFIKRTHLLTQKSRDFLIQILKKLPYIETIYPSDANYLLIKLRGVEATTLQKALMPYKIMIRNCENFDFLDARFVRIAIKEISSLKKLEHALCEISI
jgi:threonine-phosphate decarboxylase